MTQAEFQAWYHQNWLDTPRHPGNPTWTNFLRRICLMNNTTMEAVPPDILWGENAWHPEHPLSDKLIDHLFHFTVLDNEYEGIISSDTEPYCDLSDDNHGSDR